MSRSTQNESCQLNNVSRETLSKNNKMTYTPKPNQDVFDVAIQLFGDVEFAFEIIQANPQINLNTIFQGTEDLTINNELTGIVDIKNHFRNVKFVVINSDSELLQTAIGSFDSSFDNSFENEIG